MADRATDFPRFQYSEFVKIDGRDGQYVIRDDSIAEFKENHAQMRKILGLAALEISSVEKTMATGVMPEQPTVKVFPTKCFICGDKAEQRQGLNKAGKAFNGVFCLVDKTHVKWV